MKINLSSINRDNFNISEREICNTPLILINGKITSEWTEDTLVFRSSIWDLDGNLISPSYKKFFNWLEKPHLDSVSSYDISDMCTMEKIDGSCLIISPFKGSYIIRTRGVFDAKEHDNSKEIDELILKYPKVFQPKEGTSHIVEWYSPNNKIVLDYGPFSDIHLTNVINHKDYSYMYQNDLDEFAFELNVKRPRRFKFNSKESMLDEIPSMKSIEGICVYYNKDQCIRKLKTTEYLTIHRFINDLNIENMLDIYFEIGRPNYMIFEEHIFKTFDFECLSLAKGFISTICDARKEIDKILSHMKSFVENVSTLSRKEAAEKIKSAYGSTVKSGLAFGFLSKKEPDERALKKLFMQIISGGK